MRLNIEISLVHMAFIVNALRLQAEKARDEYVKIALAYLMQSPIGGHEIGIEEVRVAKAVWDTSSFVYTNMKTMCGL